MLNVRYIVKTYGVGFSVEDTIPIPNGWKLSGIGAFIPGDSEVIHYTVRAGRSTVQGTPIYDGGWAEIDSKTHNVYPVCADPCADEIKLLIYKEKPPLNLEPGIQPVTMVFKIQPHDHIGSN